MTEQKTTSEQLISNQLTAADGPVLGAITYWSLSGFRVPREEFREAFAAMGAEEAVGSDLSPKAVLTRAADRWLRGRGDCGVRRLSGGGVALLSYGTIGGVVSATHVLTVSATQSGMDVRVVAQHHERAAEMRAAFQQCWADVVSYATTADLSDALGTACKGTRKNPMLSACNLRGESGGVYFVPAARLIQFDQIKAYVESNSTSAVARFLVSDLGGNAAETQRAVVQSVEGELAELRASVLEFARECRDNGKEPGLKTINARAKRYADLRSKVDLWADMLGDVATEMRQNIKSAEANLRADLFGAETEPAAPPAAPTWVVEARIGVQENSALRDAWAVLDSYPKNNPAIPAPTIYVASNGRAGMLIKSHPILGDGLMIFEVGGERRFGEGLQPEALLTA